MPKDPSNYLKILALIVMASLIKTQDLDLMHNHKMVTGQAVSILAYIHFF